MPRLDNKIAIVTGASSGIGRAIAYEFHQEGAKVICADLQPTARPGVPAEAEKPTHELINSLGGTAEFVKVDVSKAEDVENVVARTVEKYGRLDIMINNAGVSIESTDPKGIWEFSQDVWDKDFAVNADGVFLGCKYATAQMIKQEPSASGDRGWIVNTSSFFGKVGLSGLAGYVSSKHAVMGLTRAAALDCAPYRVHVNAVCPGVTDTAFNPTLPDDLKAFMTARLPFRSFGTPKDIAKAVLFLASEDSSWITGVGLDVDGGGLAS